MAEITPVTTKSTTGYVDESRGIRGGDPGAAPDVITNGTTLQKEALKHRVFYFGPTAVGTDDTWTSGIDGIHAVAWQAATVDDEVAVTVSSVATGAIEFDAAAGSNEGWLHVWSRS